MLTIKNQTCAGKIFKCTIFVGYGGVIFLLESYLMLHVPVVQWKIWYSIPFGETRDDCAIFLLKTLKLERRL